ncbi:MAG: hypothetical protein K6G09_10140 [Treponema sp.]|nr:hypothetical protein [Treponema sp.]
MIDFFAWTHMKKLYILLFALLFVACSDVVGDYEAEYGEQYAESGAANLPSEGDDGKVSSPNDGSIGSSSSVESSSSNLKSESERVSKFNSSIQYRTLVDNRDNKAYKTVVIGNQLWMAENLNYADTICIPELKSGSSCYDGSDKNCKYYGRLYDFFAAIETCSDSATSELQGVCPDNWHLPLSSEWDELIAFVTASVGKDLVGNSLKSLEGWNVNSNGAEGSDNFGFRILPGGLREDFGKYKELGYRGAFWVADASVGSADSYELVTASIYGKKNTYVASLEDKGHSYSYSLSIRCISDSLVCNGEPYDIHKKFCSDGKLLSLCGGKNFDPAVYTCYKDSIVKIADTSKFTCGEKPVNILTQFCDNDEQIHDLCGGDSYDVAREFCHAGRVFSLCGGKEYDPEKYTCKSQVVMPLCGTVAYDSSASFCGSDDKVHALCGGKSYDVTQKFCLENEAIPLCGGETYTPSSYACVDNEVRPLCGRVTYNAATDFCAEDLTVHALCGGKTYNVQEKFCASGTAYDLCGGDAYDPVAYTCSGTTVRKYCGNTSYDTTTHFCADNEKAYEIQHFTYGSLTDVRDGKTYKTIEIANRIWMAENLNYNATNSICDSCAVFGRFYKWSEDGYCPTDWHIPSKDEWRTLLDAAGGDDIAGFRLKSIEGWSGYGGGMDSLGFGGLPSGYHRSFVKESYNGAGKTTGFWTTGSCGNSSYGTYVLLDAEKNESGFYCIEKSDYYYPIRCIKDLEYFCGSKKYDPTVKFCVDENLYPLCGGETYNVETHTCVDGNIRALCGTTPYDASEQFCTEDLNVRNLCGGRTYDVETEFCASGTVLDLCGGVEYDPVLYTCSGATVRKYCGTTSYDTTTHFCADNNKVYEIQNFTYGTLIDSRDGKTYKTIEIGSLVWMAENLNYNATNSVCDSCAVFGRFYKWASSSADYCPSGWRIPSEDDWNDLFDAAGGTAVAGFRLKSIEGWSGYGGIDSVGFVGLPSGYHRSFVNESYNGAGKTTGFWTTGSCGNSDYGAYVLLEAKEDESGFYCSEKAYYYYPIRCVKDVE